MDRLSKSLTLFHAQVLEQLEKLWVTNGFDPGLLHVLKIMLIKLWRTSPSKSGSENHLPLLDLPLHCGAGMDGRGSLAKPVAFAWALLYTAIHLLDAVEDHDFAKDLFPQNSNSCILNLATSLIVAAEQVLFELEFTGLDMQSANNLRLSFNRVLLRMAAGQHQDLCRTDPDLALCWEITGAKSGEFFALACYAGARSCTNDEKVLQGLKTYGFHLGMLLQIANDIAGLWGNGEQTSDIAKGKRTIPIVYALEILPAEDIVPLLQLIEEAAFNNEAEIRARCLVRNSGAVVYMLLEAEKHKLLAQDSLKELPLDQDEKEYLLQILESIMKPKIHEDFVLTR